MKICAFVFLMKYDLNCRTVEISPELSILASWHQHFGNTLQRDCKTETEKSIQSQMHCWDWL